VKWKFRAGAPVLSGITPTKGNVVFAGDMDEHAYAFDAATGAVLWRQICPGRQRRRGHLHDRQQAGRGVRHRDALAGIPGVGLEREDRHLRL